jgi:hypothetical protein
MAEDEKKRIEKEAEEKKKEAPWWQNLSPTTWIIAGVIIFLIIRSIGLAPENKNTYFWWLAGLGIILYLIAQRPSSKFEAMISPKEAELLVERDLERKLRWGQLPTMSKYWLDAPIQLKHTGGVGIHYQVACTVKDPYSKPRHMMATVMPKGVERGFVLFSEHIGRVTGREVVQEKPIVPDWIQRSEQYPVLKDIFLREKR